MDIWMIAIWASVFVLSIILEAQTAEMVAIWFLPGALVALVLAMCGVELWIQLVVFFISSAALLVLAKTWLKKKIRKLTNNEKTDTELLIGRLVKVVEDIDNLNERGAVKVNGQVWTARMDSDGVIAKEGEFVKVVSISGVKLICTKE